MLPQAIAIVSQSNSVSIDDLTVVAAALQKQVQRDFADIWGVSATISAFTSAENIPVGYWPIMVVDRIEGGTLGIHHDKNHQPVALVAARPNWSVIASHECLEMIVDPWGSRLVAGDSIDEPGTRVEYLVEVCDPVQDIRFAYPVNDVLVSDFYTPRYFDPVGSFGARYSFRGNLKGPREILEKGYLTWHDPSNNNWYQATREFGEIEVQGLGKTPLNATSLRQWVDSRLEGGKTAMGSGERWLKQGALLEKKQTSQRRAAIQTARLRADIGLPIAAAPTETDPIDGIAERIN